MVEFSGLFEAQKTEHRFDACVDAIGGLKQGRREYRREYERQNDDTCNLVVDMPEFQPQIGDDQSKFR